MPVDPPKVLLIDGERLNPRVEENLEGWEALRTMDGASTLSLNIHDPDGELLESGALTRRRRSKPRKGLEEAAWDRLGRTVIVYGRSATSTPHAFRLQGLGKTGSRLALRGEDEIVVLMRRHDKPFMLSRSDYTRAQFIWAMAHEVRDRPIATYIPHRRVTRRERKPDQSERGVTVESFTWGLLGRKPTKEEIRNINLVLEAAEDESAGERPTLALIEACIVEAPYFANPTGGHSSSVGILQLLNIHLGGSTSTRGGRRDIKLVCKLFLTDGFAGKGGAIALARRHPAWTPGQIAQAVQGSAFPDRYEEHRSEADEILAAYGGASGGPVEVDEPFLFYRGRLDRQPGEPKEDSWQAGTRTAQEVNFRLFTANDVLFYVQDRDLIRSRPIMTLAEQPPANGGERGVFYVGELDFDWETGRPVSEITFQAPVEQWLAYPGAVTEIRRPKPLQGRWLTWSVRETHEALADITLRRPSPAKAEPASTRQTVQSKATGSARERVIAIAEATLTSKTGHYYYRAGGETTLDPVAKAPLRSDCSQWVRAVYIKAGLPDPGINTWAQAARGRRTQRPQPGDLVFPANTSHVELFAGNGKTYGHGTEPIDAWTVAGMRSYFGSVYFVTFSFLDD